MRLSVFLCIVGLVAVCSAAGPKDTPKTKPAVKATPADSADEKEVLEGLPEACRQPVHEPEVDKKAKKDAKAADPLCTLRKPFYDDTDQASHFCIVCKLNDTSAATKKPATGPAAAATSETEIAKHLQQVVTKQLSKLDDFDDNSGLTLLIVGVDKPINISKALDDPNNDTDAVLQNVEEVLYMFKNKTMAKQDWKNGEPAGQPEEVDCTECEKQLKELKPQKRTPQQQQDQAQRRRQQEDRQREKERRRGGSTPAPEDGEDENADSEDANGEEEQRQQGRGRDSPQQYDARRRQQEEQQRRREYEEQQRRQPQYAQAAAAAAAAAYPQQAAYDRQYQRRPAAQGSAGASTKSVPAACKKEVHFTTEDGICSLHVPESTDLCITCRADRADNYQVLQSLDSLAQRLAPNNYQYLAQNAEIHLVLDPAPRDNRVIDFSREFAQHEPMVQKLEEAYYFFPNGSVTVQKFDDNGREETVEPFRTYEDYLRQYQREHEQQDQEQAAQPSPYEDGASRDYNQDYYRRQQEQQRQQQLMQQQQQARAQPAYQQSTDVYGRVYPSTAPAAARPAYDQQAQEDRRRQQYEEQQRQQRIQPTSTYTPQVYATADYYRTQPTPTTTTPAYGRTYAYTDRTTQPAYGTMMVSVVTLQPTTTITVTADQNGNVVRPTAYAPYIRPDQRGQKQTMCLVVETTMVTPQADQYRQTQQADQYRERPSSPTRPVPYAGQPGIYQRT